MDEMGWGSRETVSVRLDDAQRRRLYELTSALCQSAGGIVVGRSTAMRLVVERGLDALEREFGIAGTPALRRSPGARDPNSAGAKQSTLRNTKKSTKKPPAKKPPAKRAVKPSGAAPDVSKPKKASKAKKPKTGAKRPARARRG